MRNLRNRFERFCLRNRSKGIPNLMLYVVLGCGLVAVLSMLGYSELYSMLCFDKQAILSGQVWRLFTYIFTMSGSNILTTLIVLYCAYSLGRSVEASWGTCKFNLYYLTGIVLMDVFAMVFDGNTWLLDFRSMETVQIPLGISGYYASYMTMFLHLSLVICFATMFPDTRFLLLYIIPIKARILALFYLGFTLFEVIQLTVPLAYLPHNLFPLVATLSYFLFFGKDVLNLLPSSWRVKKASGRSAGKSEPIPFRPATQQKPAQQPNYHHRCTVCGRTDASNPELEFRYCSRCNGYYCYCQDHINDHTHIQ